MCRDPLLLVLALPIACAACSADALPIGEATVDAAAAWDIAQFECFSDSDCKDPAAPRCRLDRNSCVACLLENDNCGPRTYCVFGQHGRGYYVCEPGCKDDSDCPLTPSTPMLKYCAVSSRPQSCVECTRDEHCQAGLRCCAPAQPQCINTAADLKNCGACGLRCPTGASCENGQCGPCPDGTTPCNDGGGSPGDSTCVNLNKSTTNCGACGNRCPSGWNCCSGRCSDPSSDSMNCSACGHGCAPGQQCVNRLCR